MRHLHLHQHQQTLGVVHVLAGPDHLSALATICASETTRTSFLLGLQWGVGHSIGLLVVGGIFIAITSQNDGHDTIEIPESVTKIFENLVGIFMICLGVFGIHRAWLKRKRLSEPTTTNDVDDEENASRPTEELLVHVAGAAFVSPVDATSSQPERLEIHDDPVNEEEEGDGVIIDPSATPRVTPTDAGSEVASSPRCGWSFHRHCCSSSSVLSLIAGLVHGLAGPGGVLGVLPAVQIRDPLLGSVYLITFCLFSTLTMGSFAACYGRIFAKRIGWEFRIECMSAMLSVLVGILWLVLVSTDKMGDVFG